MDVARSPIATRTNGDLTSAEVFAAHRAGPGLVDGFKRTAADATRFEWVSESPRSRPVTRLRIPDLG